MIPYVSPLSVIILRMKYFWRRMESWLQDSIVATSIMEYSPKLRTAVKNAVGTKLTFGNLPRFTKQELQAEIWTSYQTGFITKIDMSHRFEPNLNWWWHEKNNFIEIPITNITYTNGKDKLWYSIDGKYMSIKWKEIIITQDLLKCFIKLNENSFVQL